MSRMSDYDIQIDEHVRAALRLTMEAGATPLDAAAQIGRRIIDIVGVRPDTCAKCGRPITQDDWVWYHTDSGLPPCDPDAVDPDAYLDIEGDKYDIATPEGV